jgi:hypothetical protein
METKKTPTKDVATKLDNIYTALATFREKVQPIEKDSTNPHFKSKYADLASIIEAIKQPLKESGLTLFHTVKSIE